MRNKSQMSKCQRKSLQPDIFDRNMMRCLNILLAQRSDMRDESKAFFLSLINAARIRRLDQAVKTETKEELKHLSSQSWQNPTLVSDYAPANYLFHASRHDQSRINNRLLTSGPTVMESACITGISLAKV